MEGVEKSYPEFENLTRSEIQVRLDAFDHLINSEMKKEFENSQQEMLWEHENSSETDLKPIGIPDNFNIVAHRGWSGSYPENTLIGLREAIKLGCHMIEFDVTLTEDRKPIIIHDSTLSRTTNGCGFVKNFKFRDLRKLDAGSWFHPRYAGAHLPSLDEILLISRGAGIMVNIEIKSECYDENQKPDGIESQIIAAIHRYQVRDRVVISSFRWDFIERIHKIDPGVRTALLHYKNLGHLEPQELKEKFGCYSFNPHSVELNQKFVDRCHEAGFKVFPFTINSYKEMEQYLNMGVDGMFTNHPNRLFRFLEEHGHHLNELSEREKVENKDDVKAALEKLEKEELDKARKRARWRAKRLLLQNQKAAKN